MSEALKNRKAFYNTTIPVDWDAYELTRVSEKIMVGIASAATHAYRNEGIILFRNQNIKEGYLDDSDILYIDETYEKAHKNKRLKGGDILIARTGYPGTACLVPDKYIGAQSFTTLIVRPKHELIDKEFLCLYVNSEFGQGYFETNQIGGGQKNVNAGTLETMPIPVPPLPEQKAIAQVLSTADAAIHTTEKLIAQKELHKKWLMQQLLTGKKRLKGFGGEWKEHSYEKILKVVKRNFDWDENELYKLISVRRRSGGIFYREALYGHQILVKTLRTANEGDFLFSKMQILHGASALVTKEFDGAKISGSYIAVVPKDKKQLNMEFFQWYSQTPYFYHQTYISSYGVHIEKMTFDFDTFLQLEMKLPSIEEQTAIAQVLLAADKEISLLKAKADKLREQKKGLMQQLLTGKVRLEIDKVKTA
ncbi:restriction endonuclease subunit S [Flavobacterium sp.]|uniref:restriction endonuclease subunit S n=1 Tax=Flavobacterium sp. TaxID=239 RepID=UPI00262AC71D|nr:restriction endonuclease subunit S [Flavobacterium sp.]